MVRVGSVDDGEDAKSERGHPVGHAAQNLVGIGHGKAAPWPRGPGRRPGPFRPAR